jgi:serine/threonine protein phosphatase 1
MRDPDSSSPAETESVSIEVSQWQEGAIDTAGEAIFVVGDVHGCALQLRTLLETFAQFRLQIARPVRLVFLGDVIDRGPNSIEALRLWAAAESLVRDVSVERLMGNHEQLLLLAIREGTFAHRAERLWLELGGRSLVRELREAISSPDARISEVLIKSCLGNAVWRRLNDLKPFRVVGNLLFVHAGVHPERVRMEFLGLSAQTLPDDKCHWGWIEDEFLRWSNGFGGTIVVHGMCLQPDTGC